MPYDRGSLSLSNTHTGAHAHTPVYAYTHAQNTNNKLGKMGKDH